MLYWSAVLCGFGALATIATLVISFVSDNSARSRGREGTLAITEAYVRNGSEESYNDANGGEVQTLASSPAVEILIFNGSARHVLIEGARVTIESYAHLNLCFSQGGGPIPEPPPYVIRLPSFPLPSEDLIESHLHDEIDPENADRMVLRFGALLRSFGGYDLYKLSIQLHVYGERKLLDAGHFVLSTPANIPPDDGYFPESNASLKQFTSGDFRSARLSVTWCLKRNLASLRSLLAGPDKRSPELALLDHPVLASHWSLLQNYTSPRSAALQLLHQKQPELAVFAARTTKNGVFEQAVRRRAVRQLLSEAEKQVAAGGVPQLGERDVRIALQIDPSARGREMLMEFERRLASRSAFIQPR